MDRHRPRRDPSSLGSFYQVSPEEIGVILRFGKFVRTSEPGLHMKLPLGIERLTRVPVQRQLKEEFGFRTVRAGIQSEFITTAETKGESVMLTGDLNVVDAEWIVQFKIRDPYPLPVQDAGGHNDLPRHDRSRCPARRRRQLRRRGHHRRPDPHRGPGQGPPAAASATPTRSASRSTSSSSRTSTRPETVKPSFNDVNEALQEKERKINDAWAEYNQEIPKASGEAEQMIRGAEGYATERVNNASGDASRFSSVYREYAKAPAVTRKRLYLEALNDILPKITRKIVVDQNQKNVLPLLNLGEEVKK